MLRSIMMVMVLLVASNVRADVFVIAPPYYEGTDGQSLADEIARIVQEDLEKQHEVVGPKQAAALVPREDRVSCPEGECAERYRSASGAVAAVVIRVGRAGVGAGPATSFQLGIQPAPGVEYTQGALLSDGPLKEIAVKAIREAFRDYRDPGPWLTVSGAPQGASVYVDERAVGVLPWTDRLSLGTHRVRVEARGFAPMIKIVGLTSPTERKRLEFRLEPGRAGEITAGVGLSSGLAPNSSSQQRDEESATRLIRWGIASAAVATAALVTWGIAQGLGGCQARDGGACNTEEEVPMGWKAGLGVVGGIAAGAAIGLVGYGWHTRAKARVSLAPAGILMRGSF